MNWRGSLLMGVAAALSIGGVFAVQASVTADRVLTTMAYDQVPSVVMDETAQRIVVFTDADRWATNGTGAEAHVLDENGQVLSSVPIGPQPSQTLVDPRTGHIFVLTAGTSGAAGDFFSSGVDLNVLDPTHALLLGTTSLQTPAAPSTMNRPFFGGGRPPSSAGTRPPAWLMSYRSITTLGSTGTMALDAQHRRLFVATGGGGGGFSGRGFVLANGPAQLSVLNADTSAVLRTLPLPVGVVAMATDPATDRLYLMDRTGTLRILDERTLTQLASRHIGGADAQVAVDQRLSRVFVLDTAAGTVTTLDGTRATVLGVASVLPGATGMQVDERAGHVFVESAGTSGYALQNAGPGSVGMIDAASGALLRTLPVGPLPLGAALDAQHRRLFVSSYSADANGGVGSVQVFDTDSGAPLRSIVVSTGPFSLVEDAQREHLAVAGTSTSGPPASGWDDAVARVRQLLGPVAASSSGSALLGDGGSQGAVSVVAADN